MAEKMAATEVQTHQESILTLVRTLISQGDSAGVADLSAEIFAAGIEKEVEREILAAPMPCPKCGTNMTRTIMPFGGWLTHCAVCEEAAEKAKENAQTEALSGLRDRLAINSADFLARCGVPRRYQSAMIDHFPPAVRKLSDTEEGIFLTGGRGTGKTHLATALMREKLFRIEPIVEWRGTLDNGDSMSARLPWMPQFLSVPELLLKVRATFGRDRVSASWRDHQDTEEEIIEKYSAVPLLVLDDLGAEKSSEWALSVLYIIIDRRYRNMLRTIITSNLSLDEIAVKLDDRISSRIAGMCRVVPLKGKDRRLENQ